MDARALRVAGVLLLTTLLGAAAQADVLILRDGSRKTGRLQSCSDGQCRFVGVPILTVEIGWIGFGGKDGNEDLPPAVVDGSQDEVHLANGAVATGTLASITGGAVLFNDRVFDRATVRWLHFAGGPGGGGTAPPDLLVFRDGSSRNGDLQGCTSGACILAGQTLPRDRIAWLGFRQGSSLPPPTADPTRDAIVLRDRSVHSARVLSVDASRVLTAGDAYARADVAWIYLAPPAPTSPP